MRDYVYLVNIRSSNFTVEVRYESPESLHPREVAKLVADRLGFSMESVTRVRQEVMAPKRYDFNPSQWRKDENHIPQYQD